MYTDLFMIGLGFLLIATRQYWLRISLVMVYLVPSIAYVALVSALAIFVKTSWLALFRLHDLVLQPVFAGALSSFEAQELVARRLCLHDSVWQAGALLLPWPSSSWISITFGILASLCLLWTATEPFVAMVRAHSSGPVSSRRRRVELALAVLAGMTLILWAVYFHVSTSNIFDSAVQMTHTAAHLYEDRCSFSNSGDIKCRVLNSAVKLTVDESGPGRLYYVYRAVKWEVERRKALTLKVLENMAFFAAFLVGRIKPILE
ncbi:hypothetical protein JCM9279_005757 [Rhodotorula babjevae]